MLKTLAGFVSLVALAVPAAAQDAPYQRQARDVYERLISFRTAEGHGQVPAMTAYIAETLKAGGVPAEDIVIIPHKETAAMLVRIPGRDRSMRKILFSAHMDVVDARPEDWERSPFKLVEENGYFFGRGTGDNKQGVAALVSTILRLKADKAMPARALTFAFVGDEETGMETTRLIADHEWVKGAEYAINTDAGGGTLDEQGKPTVYGVQGAEKTYATYFLTLRNPGGHSSRPRNDNAIYDLAKVLNGIQALQFPAQANALTRASLRLAAKTTPGEKGKMLARFADNPDDAEAAAYLLADPTVAYEISTTCVATMLDAGHAENALPQRAKATVNCRIYPGDTVEGVKGRLAEAAGNKNVVVEVDGAPVVSPVSEPRSDVMAAIAKSVHARYPGIPISPYLEAGGTDGMIYRTKGIPTFASSGVFMKDSDVFFHGLNERLPVKAFYEAIDHVHDLAVDLGGARPAGK
ncbi:M20/M25/M40 family metallo-hydrolase [Sphingosinicella rhizophila]|uniref:M20/M25/M40 family metallo-hydrolase n=1 Tax=Sphingosinicella rhizophila TaxID=3050082 RepID=A0ABU3Q9Z1_9SPHN|nr:M20/M25/M40 family metallo-hydrolase [Sphingosinicella sp. GR2756]MDT9600132.1 M20/M25/M40 family metallo-hydrolase [Sphingosinicella sp. GR2756]